MPRMSPPTTAPTALSRPPITAAVKPSTKIESMLLGYRNVDGDTSTPARAPSRPASAQPTVITRATRMPDRRATVALNAAARMRSPALVYLNPMASSSAAARTATATNTSERDTPSGVDPALSPTTENAAGNDRYWPPYRMPARPSRRMSRPMVMITALSSGLPRAGRITTSSATAPSTTPAASATANPAQYEPVWRITSSA